MTSVSAAGQRTWRSRSAGRLAGERGSATAEFAAAMPAVVLLLAGSLFAINAGITQVRCVDAARDGALAESRGASGLDVAEARAPDEAMVEIDEAAGLITARVSVTVTPWGGWLPGIEVHGEATTAREPGHGT